MKCHVTTDQLAALTPAAQTSLEDWFFHHFTPDPQISRTYRDTIQVFRFGDSTVLPLMDVTLMWAFLEHHRLPHHGQTVDALWTEVALVLENGL